jgi:hypothetical protein
MAMMGGDTQTLIEFKKGDKVIIPRYLWKGSRQTGVIDNNEALEFEGSKWYCVRLYYPPTVRYRQKTADNSVGLVLIDGSELRRKVLHPDCPSCLCASVRGEVDEFEDEEEEEDEGEDDEDEESFPKDSPG